MMWWLIFIAVMTAWFAAWVAVVRPWMRDKPWAKGFFERIEPIEIALWQKSETILFARFKIFVGLLLTMLTQIGTIDITPLLPLVPDKYEPVLLLFVNSLPLIISALGWVDEMLRKDTTKPLEVVAVPSDAPADVKQAVDKVELQNAKAVAKVEEAKAEGAM